MEVDSYYLVTVELLIALGGFFQFYYQIFTKKPKLLKADIYFLLLTVISAFWFVLGDDEGRWLSLKASLFVCCVYLSSKFPRQALLIICTLLLVGYLLDNVASGYILSKHVGENSNQILVIPFLLITCTLLLLKQDENINLKLLYFVAVIQIICALIIGARAAAIAGMAVIVLVGSIGISRAFIKYGQWIPFVYLIAALLGYWGLVFESKAVSATPSNIERSSMIFAAESHFFDYLFTGPRAGFDQLAMHSMDAINCEPEKKIVGGWAVFECKVYKNNKGVDPHTFFLSLWRDEGAILTTLWILAWFFYWKKLEKLNTMLNEKKVRVIIGMLAIGIIQFSISPPSTGLRIAVALIMGSALGFTKNDSLTKYSAHAIK